MRILSVYISAVFWLASCYSPQEVVVDITDPALKEIGPRLTLHGANFSGSVIERDAKGNLRRSVTYKEGVQHGVTRTWYPDGRLESERNYLRGEKDGVHMGWWPNGNKQFEYHFSRGAYDGSFNEWYENGRPLHAFQYSHGREVSAVGWRDNGKTYINFVVRNGRRYGLTNSRLCYSLKDENGVFGGGVVSSKYKR